MSLLCGILGGVCVWLRNIEDGALLLPKYPRLFLGGVEGARAAGDGPEVMDNVFLMDSTTGLLAGVGHFAVDAYGLIYILPEVVVYGWYKYWVPPGSAPVA